MKIARRLRRPRRRQRWSPPASCARPSRIGVIATAATAATRTCAKRFGQIAAQHFDVCIIREDVALRGRKRGDTAQPVLEGVREAMAQGARCKQAEMSLDEIEAVRHAMNRANPGDLVVVCVDKHAEVMAELENWSDVAQGRIGCQPRRPPPPTPTTRRLRTPEPQPLRHAEAARTFCDNVSGVSAVPPCSAIQS